MHLAGLFEVDVESSGNIHLTNTDCAEEFETLKQILLSQAQSWCSVKMVPAAIGNLLTISSLPGYAIKAERPSAAFGAVMGKALRPLRERQGVIPILIALQ